MVDDKLLARHLVQTNTCSRELLLEGRRLQREAEDEGTLYDALLTHGLVEEATLVGAAATLLNLPSIQLDRFTFDDDLVRLITRDMAVTNQVIPLKRKNDGVMLAMIDPLDIMAMDDIATQIGADIQPVLVGRGDLAAAIDRAYPLLAEDSAIDLGVVGDEIPSVGSNGLEQDSWASFFDDAVSVDVDRESASISQDMRDRPTSLEMSLDELGIEDSPGISSGTSDILESFDAPPPEGAGTAHDDDLLELGEWEVGDDNGVPGHAIPKATPDASGEIDYGTAGDLYIQAEDPSDEDEDDELVFILEDIADDEEEDSIIELDDEVESGPVFVLDEVADPEGEPDVHGAPTPRDDGDIFEDVFAEVADDVSAEEEGFEVLDEPEPEPEPASKPSALSSLRARLASVKLSSLPKPNTKAAKPAVVAKKSAAPVEDEDAPPNADAAPSGQTLGRVAVKRIAVKRQTAEMALPDVVEKNTAQERKSAAINLTQEIDPDDILGESIEEEPELTLSHDDLFDSAPDGDEDAIDLGDFKADDDSSELDVMPTTEFDPDAFAADIDPPTREVQLDDIGMSDPPTREIQLDDVFGSIGEGVGAESTNASDDVQSEIEQLSRSLRKPIPTGGNRFSGEFSPVQEMSRETTANEALTRDRIAQMSRDRKLSQAGITSSSATLLNLPENVSEGQLLRALVTVLLDRKIIDRAELIELAEALPSE